MGRPRNKRFVQAKEAASVVHDGEQVALNEGKTILADDHPIVRAYPHFFKPLEPSRMRPEVEQMTASPGEHR